MGKDVSKRPRDGGQKLSNSSFELKGRRVLAPEIEKIAVDLEIAPDFTLTAIFPKPKRTLQDIIDGRESSDSGPNMPTEKLSSAERSKRLKEIGEKMKKGR